MSDYTYLFNTDLWTVKVQQTFVFSFVMQIYELIFVTTMTSNIILDNIIKACDKNTLNYIFLFTMWWIMILEACTLCLNKSKSQCVYHFAAVKSTH